MKLIPNIFDSILIEEKSNRHEALKRFHQQPTIEEETYRKKVTLCNQNIIIEISYSNGYKKNKYF